MLCYLVGVDHTYMPSNTGVIQGVLGTNWGTFPWESCIEKVSIGNNPPYRGFSAFR